MHSSVRLKTRSTPPPPARGQSAGQSVSRPASRMRIARHHRKKKKVRRCVRARISLRSAASDGDGGGESVSRRSRRPIFAVCCTSRRWKKRCMRRAREVGCNGIAHTANAHAIEIIVRYVRAPIKPLSLPMQHQPTNQPSAYDICACV